MNEVQLDLAQKLKDEVEKNEPKPEPVKPANETLLALQKQATAVARESKDAEWAALSNYDYKQVPPHVMARLYKELNLGTMAQCLALALERYETGKNPLKGHIYILPSGRIGTSLEGMLIDMKREGVKVGKPQYSNTSRPWRKGIVLTRKELGRSIDVTEKDFDGKEPGKICRMSIDGEDVEYTCWLTEWFMGGNPNWWNRMDWMMEVRSQMNCLKLGSGVSISEEIVDTDSAPKIEMGVKAPKETPFGGK